MEAREGDSRQGGGTQLVDVAIDEVMIERRQRQQRGELMAYKSVDQCLTLNFFLGSSFQPDTHNPQSASTALFNESIQTAIGNVESDVEEEADWHDEGDIAQCHPTRRSEAVLTEVRSK
jgi:hypothetical protein